MKKLSLVILMMLLVPFSQAQNQSWSDTAREVQDQEVQKDQSREKKGFRPENLYFGGGLELSFGSYTVIGVNPLVAYKFRPKLSGGAQFSYEFSSQNRHSASNYGLGIFGRYRVILPFYVHAEFSGYNYEVFTPSDKDRVWVPFFLVGGGYSHAMAKNVWLNAQVLFDLIHHHKSPYKNWEPFFNIGVGVGF